MKRILFLTGLGSLLFTTGCLVSEGRRHEGYSSGREGYERHSDVEVRVPVVEVRPPEVIIR